MISNQTITAVIPVIAGSRRLPNKNILPFGDSNLLIHKIRQLKQVNEIDNIVVSSDSDKMLKMAETEGVLTHKREIEYCDEKTKLEKYRKNDITFEFFEEINSMDKVLDYVVLPVIDYYEKELSNKTNEVLFKVQSNLNEATNNIKKYINEA